MIKKNKRFHYDPRYNQADRSYFQKKPRHYNSNFRISDYFRDLFIIRSLTKDFSISPSKMYEKV